jgi:DNA-binding Lrp family transcriptional regulator
LELGIPLTTVYRRLRLLEDLELIQNVKTIINYYAGNEEKYYRCAINEVTVSFQSGMLSVNLKMEDYNDKIVRLWKRLTQPDAREMRI